MEYIYSFERLEVWRDSKELAKEVYKLTENLPQTEKYGLSSQMRRAAISVSSNIAEGSSRLTQKAKGQFYSIAYSSLMELYNQLIISGEMGLLEYYKETMKRIIRYQIT